jgi:hypothetical protein
METLERTEERFDESLSNGPAAERMTEMEIHVDALDGALADFLDDEKKRSEQKRGWINDLLQKLDQEAKQHSQAITEQEDLYQHGRAKRFAQLKALGYEIPDEQPYSGYDHPPIVVVTGTGTGASVTHLTPAQERMKKAREARAAKKLAGSAPAPEPAKRRGRPAAKKGKTGVKRSAATRKKMALAAKKRWAAKRAAEGAPKKKEKA